MATKYKETMNVFIEANKIADEKAGHLERAIRNSASEQPSEKKAAGTHHPKKTEPAKQAA